MNLISPIYIVAVSLGIAFFMGLLGKKTQRVSYLLLLAALLFNTAVSLQWVYALGNGMAEATQIFTSGFKPPFSINLLMGLNESVITSMVNIAGVLGAIYMMTSLKKNGIGSQVVFLVLFMSLNVVVLSRDLFNIFVFLEVGSIAIAGLIILQKGTNAISAGFKYMLATGILAGILLIGIIFIYRFTGSLNIDSIIASNPILKQGAFVSVFLILIAIVIELKSFPANGWGLDAYEASHPGVGAILSAASATAIYFVLYKILEMAGSQFNYYVALIGAVSFVGSNLLALKQDNSKRLLGYSSIGQIGLLMIVLGFKDILGENTTYVAFGILVSHYLAKAGLFWLAGIVKQKDIKGWAVIRKKPYFLFLMGTFIFALIGFPPFPSFFAKWTLVMDLVNSGNIIWVVAILFGSMMEAVYMIRWFGYAIKGENENIEDFKIKLHKIIPVGIVAVALYVAGYFMAPSTGVGTAINFIPLYFVAAIFILDFLPVFIKNTIAIIGMAVYFYFIYPDLDNMRLIFEAIFMVGGILTLIAGYAYKGSRQGFYPVALLMYAGLTTIIEAQTTLQFFFGWEVMTAGSYFLIIRGKRSMPHGLSYMLFSIGGAYAL
ncbi:MAG: NADH-quinone oxidoreductase subunit F, partial [Draconibacterium sp.]|nr:NADH-quinone oxidoreductase subunit F [Draconibacterium sp.]